MAPASSLTTVLLRHENQGFKASPNGKNLVCDLCQTNLSKNGTVDHGNISKHCRTTKHRRRLFADAKDAATETDELYRDGSCLCCKRFESRRRFSVHQKTDFHRKRRLRFEEDRKRPKEKVTNEITAMDFLEMLARAHVPLEAANVSKEFLDKYSDLSGAIPSAQALRKKYMKRLSEKARSDVRSLIGEGTYSIVCDSSTNTGLHSFCTILVPENQAKGFVTSLDYCDSANNAFISQKIKEVVKQYDLAPGKCMTFVSDAAAANVKSYVCELQPFFPSSNFVICWAHRFNILEKIFVDGAILTSQSVTLIRKIFNPNSLRRENWLIFLLLKERAPKSVPIYVCSRWGSWFCCIFFVPDYFFELRGFIGLLTPKSNSQKQCADLFRKHSFALITELLFLTKIGMKLNDCIDFFECNSLPAAPYVTKIVSNVRRFLKDQSDPELFQFVIPHAKFSDRLWSKLVKVTQHLTAVSERAVAKLDEIIRNYPSWNYFEQVWFAFAWHF